jgi:hypothetical protein
MAAIRTVAAGDALLSSSTARRLIERFVQAAPAAPGLQAVIAAYETGLIQPRSRRTS